MPDNINDKENPGFGKDMDKQDKDFGRQGQGQTGGGTNLPKRDEELPEDQRKGQSEEQRESEKIGSGDVSRDVDVRR